MVSTLLVYVIAKLTFTCLLGPLTIQEMHCVVAFPLPSFDHGFCGRSFSPLAPFRVLLISLALVLSDCGILKSILKVQTPGIAASSREHSIVLGGEGQ